MATTLDRPFSTYARPAATTRAEAFAWHAYAVVAAAVMIVTGMIWDISWHMSIGRDTFWTPAHMLIQGGGLLAGLSSGVVALKTTFRGTPQAKASAVWFWGFRAPMGAWVAILGCGAMLTSAPFDDWWHNAYGLDVRIISPPHILLGLGMMGIVLGATLRSLALQNSDDDVLRQRGALLFALSSGLFLSILAILLMDWSGLTRMHSGSFYTALSMTLPIVLVATAVAGRSRWPATTAAMIYMIVFGGTSWVLMLFPAVPKLGPIYRDITHYVPLNFPLLLVVPAFAIDLVWRRARTWPHFSASVAFAFAFVLALLATQWPFANFLMAHGRNWFFHIDNFVYWMPVTSEPNAFRFRLARGAPPLYSGIARALAYAIIASWIGLKRGEWMGRVRR
ncbi:MAG: hypothetical protein M3Z05_10345 [Gemmatimonadota bacterium]|nr:hypothetical protein [Gemmatimonadota bacterium]